MALYELTSVYLHICKDKENNNSNESSVIQILSHIYVSTPLASKYTYYVIELHKFPFNCLFLLSDYYVLHRLLISSTSVELHQL